MTRRRVNLLPREIEIRRRQRRLVTNAIFGGILVIAVLIVIFVAESVRLSSEKHRLEVQKQRNAALQAQIGQLAQFEQLQAQLKEKTDLLNTLTAGEVRWSVVLGDISLVIPADAWLTSFTGSVNAVPAAGSFGSVLLNGTTFSHLDVAKWLTRLAGVREFLSPYLSLSVKATVGSTPVVNFTSTVQLSDKGLRSNQPGAERRP